MSDSPLISIIDDDESVRLATASLLRSEGYRTELFASAEEFLASDAARFACVVSDIQMAGMSGIDLTGQLLAEDADARIILMTARTEEDLHQRAGTSGAVCLLCKPFAAEQLLNCVERALTRG